VRARRRAEVAKTKAEESIRKILSSPQEGWLIVGRRKDGKIAVFNKWRGRLKAWLLPSIEALINIMVLAAMRGKFPAKHHYFEIYILEMEHVKMFHEVARPYEIKTENEGVV
jgi:hypothetical protein